MCKVSIIIPVYNSENTIDKCIQSIIKQTYQDYEIIAINDGSTDRSLTILKKYETKLYSKIKVIDQKNCGVAKTRNKAMKIADGKYIIFVDNDDYLDEDYIENYVKIIEGEDLDIVIGGYRRITEENKILESRYPGKNNWSKYTIITPWAKIYNKEFILKNKIDFLDYGIGEDIYFCLQILDKTDKIKAIDYIGYNWFYNAASISNTKHKGFNKNIDIIFLIEELKNKVSGNGKIDKRILDYYYIRIILWYLLYSGRTANYKEFIEQYNYLKNYLKENIPNYQKIVLYEMPRGEIKKIAIIMKMFVLIDKFRLGKIFAKLYCRG